ncbi:unnamed protein product [Strongylus vulgaris]|uniref:Uncharacterized protein n=1 Tax=Strongylus vulgaris TaxID=40348 RepID=A0A3P7JZX8_STRVU|nr:unnamed protein product [Strongylus vulgaris]
MKRKTQFWQGNKVTEWVTPFYQMRCCSSTISLMDASLRSHRVQACDGEKVTLHCPRNTHIMIETG